MLEHGLAQAVKRGDLPQEMATTVAYDGRKNAYSPSQLPIDKVQLDVNLPPKPMVGATTAKPPADQARPRPFKLTFTQVATVDLEILEPFCAGDRNTIQAGGATTNEKVTTALQALDVLIRHEPAKKYKAHGGGGRRFFDPKLAVKISGGAEVYKGFFASIRPTLSGPVLNIDVAFSAFVSGGDFLTVAAEILGLGGGGGGGGRGGRGGRGGADRGGRGGGRGGPPQGAHGGGALRLDPRQQQELRKRLRMVQVQVTHRPTNRLLGTSLGCSRRRHKQQLTFARFRPFVVFKGFSPKPANQTTFTLQDGKQVSRVICRRRQPRLLTIHPRLLCAFNSDNRCRLLLQNVQYPSTPSRVALPRPRRWGYLCTSGARDHRSWHADEPPQAQRGPGEPNRLDGWCIKSTSRGLTIPSLLTVADLGHAQNQCSETGRARRSHC